MKYVLAVFAGVLLTQLGYADTYRLNPDGTVTPVAVTVAVAPAPRAKESPKSCPCDSCDCAGGKCDCGPACSCPSCPAAPPGYAAVYARVLKGERVVFEVHHRIGEWDRGVWECWLENGVPTCKLRQTFVVPVVPASRPVNRFVMPAGVCIGGT